MLAKSLLIFPAIILAVSGEADRPEVKTPLGKVKGYLRKSNGGRQFSVFEGIPYAKPPIGVRRFEPPEPMTPWLGTWDAIFVSQCVQTAMTKINQVEGEEDCLYVNVYVPRPQPSPQDKLDVVVHIHGGAFMYGSGDSYANPQFLMDKDIIFVTFNYRLGLFGFLSTEDDAVSGNLGLKDQQMALKWVQNNIKSFGGNPKSVTLTGLSAGGSSVHYHLLAESSKGLFHKAMSNSGVALNPWALHKAPRQNAQLLAHSVGCDSPISIVFVDCMKQRPYRQLISKMYLFYGFLALPISPFGPVVEKGDSPFLSKHPYELMLEGRMHKVPWIVSNTEHEGMLPAAFLTAHLDLIDQNFTQLAPFLLDYNHTFTDQAVAQKIKQFYFKDGKIGEETFQSFVKMFSDRLFYVDTETSVKLAAKHGKSPVYYYRFGYAGDHSKNHTVAHADDGQYFFFNMFRRSDISPNEFKMSNVMVDMLVNFMTNGEPQISNEWKWKATGEKQLTYVKIADFENITLETVEEMSPVGFWQGLGLKENQNLVRFKDEL